VLHLPDEHGVAEMEVRGGRVEPNLDHQWSAQRQSGAKVVQPDDIHASLGETGDLLVNCHGC
jgi:hypothetical protein